jgi:2-polyprenyl-6-methoxyphenol hydroxylase-like FAD-dependent oxidoreductase
MNDIAGPDSPAPQALPPGPGAPKTREADVVVIGAGLCGASAAVLLGRAGYRVVLVDRHAVCPSQFRLEHIAEDQARALDRVGLLEPIAAGGAFIDHIVNARNGRIIDHTYGADYGLRYEDMVQIVREQLPATVECVFDRVTDVSTSPALQHVALASQGSITARLLVLATGMGDMLHEKLGMRRIVTFEKHSIDFGFDLAPAPGRRFPFPALTYYGETTADGIDYINIFPFPSTMRANVFTFRSDQDPWVRDMVRAPKQTLLATLPGLARFLGDFQVTSPVRIWTMNLSETRGCEQPGVVVVGDAFQTSSPAAGTGLTRLLTDVERLCFVYAPKWLAAGDAGREKIAEFYADAEKTAMDRMAIARAHHRRRLTLDNGLKWTARRRLHYLRRGLAAWMSAAGEAQGRGLDRPTPVH